MSTRPPAVNGVSYLYPPEQVISFDPVAFDAVIRSQGVELLHFRAMKCPGGMRSRDDHRRSCEDHANCSNGNVYTHAGQITCLFVSAGNDRKTEDFGSIDGATATVSAPRFYDDSETRAHVSPLDRFYLKDDAILVPHNQLVEAHISGRDRLSYPVVDVVDLMDSSLKRYDHSDFAIENGQIVWYPGHAPGIDPETGKGLVYSVRYMYRPYYYVDRVLHQVRVAQVQTAIERFVTQMPQQFVLVREIVFENEKKDAQSVDPGSARQVEGPRVGLFGPR